MKTNAVSAVILKTQDGILLVKRKYEPGAGSLTLPGGYIEKYETWQEGSCREINEELNLKIKPHNLSLFGIETSPISGNLIIFSICNEIIDVNQITLSEELLDFEIFQSSVDKLNLTFKTHEKAIKDYIDGFSG